MGDQTEELTLVNENGEPLEAISRIKAIEGNSLSDNSYILAVQLWIINPKTKEVLMQKRTMLKDRDPGMRDICSGHVKNGESPMQAMLREANEELGILPENLMPKLKDLGKIKVDFTKSGRKGKYMACEYLAFLDYPIEYYTKQDEEVDELFWMPYEELKADIRKCSSDMRIPYNEETEKLFAMIDKEIEERNKNNEER